MGDAQPPGALMLTASELSRAIGTRVQAITTWARRHEDFPAARGRGPQKVYPAAELVDWLDRRVIPRTRRDDGEGPDASYGARLRGYLGMARPGPGVATAPGGSSPEPSGGERCHVPAGPGRSSSRGERDPWQPVLRSVAGGDKATQQDVVTTLLWLRHRSPRLWPGLVHGQGQAVPAAVRRCFDHAAGSLGIEPPPHLPSAFTEPWWSHRLPRLAQAVEQALADHARAGPAPAPGQTEPSSIAAAFEDLLDRLAQDRHDSLGWFLTPRGIVETMTRLVDPQPGERILDPCCGSGELLVAAGRHLLATDDAPGMNQPRLHGLAQNERARLTTLINADLHDLAVNVDTEAGQLPPSLLRRTHPADVVLVNPPFTTSPWIGSDTTDPPEWPYGPPPSHNPSYAWLQMVVSTLSDTGRAAILMPTGATDPSHPREQAILERMLEDGVIRCVIDLPGHLFRETTVPVSIWLLSRAAIGPREQLLLIDAASLTERSTPSHRLLPTAGQDRLVDTWQHWRDPRPDAGPPRRDPALPDVAVTPTLQQARENAHVIAPARYLPRRPLPRTQHSPRNIRATEASRADLRRELDQLQARAHDLDTALDGLLGDLATTLPATNLDTITGSHPAGWQTAPLGSVCNILTGSARLSTHPAQPDGVPVLSAAQLVSGKIRLNHAKRIHPQDADRFLNHEVRPTDILISRKGQQRHHALAEPEHAGALVDSGCIRLRPHDGLLGGYLHHYLTHPGVREWLDSRTKHGVIANLQAARLRQLPVLLPPLAEQWRILNAFALVDDAITTHDQIRTVTQNLRAHLIQPLLAGAPGP
jgi:type I restriction enzyme M protein